MLDQLYTDMLNRNFKHMTEIEYVAKLNGYISQQTAELKLSSKIDGQVSNLLNEMLDSEELLVNFLEAIESMPCISTARNCLYPLWEILCRKTANLHEYSEIGQYAEFAEYLHNVLTNSKNPENLDVYTHTYRAVTYNNSSLGFNAIWADCNNSENPMIDYLSNPSKQDKHIFRYFNNPALIRYIKDDLDNNSEPDGLLIQLAYQHTIDGGLKDRLSSEIIRETLESINTANDTPCIDYEYSDYAGYQPIVAQIMRQQPKQYFEVLQHCSDISTAKHLTAILLKDSNIQIKPEDQDLWLQILELSEQTTNNEFKVVLDQIYPEHSMKKVSKHKKGPKSLSL